MTATPATLTITARRAALSTICSQCDQRREGMHLICEKLGRNIIEDITAGAPFCPIGRHDAAFDTAINLLPIAQRGTVERRSTRLRRFREAALKVWLSIFGSCRTDEVTIAQRRATCAGCEDRRVRCGVNLCRQCGCSIRLKTRLALEECPAKKWAKAKPFTSCRWMRALIALGWIGSGCGGCKRG
jgi:hypothetical protein